MARIPTDELERLKREVSVRGLAEARGVKLEPHGDNLIGLCPFHDDKDPSLVISPKKNLWNCLGACSKGGSVTAFRSVEKKTPLCTGFYKSLLFPKCARSTPTLNVAASLSRVTSPF
jgi:hypothetical protein